MSRVPTHLITLTGTKWLSLGMAMPCPVSDHPVVNQGLSMIKLCAFSHIKELQ